MTKISTAGPHNFSTATVKMQFATGYLSMEMCRNPIRRQEIIVAQKRK